MAIRNSVDHEAIFMKWINENLIIAWARSLVLNMDFRILEWLWILYIFLCFCFEGIKESINDVTGNYLNFPIRGFNIPMQLFVIISNIVLLLFSVLSKWYIWHQMCNSSCLAHFTAIIWNWHNIQPQKEVYTGRISVSKI